MSESMDETMFEKWKTEHVTGVDFKRRGGIALMEMAWYACAEQLIAQHAEELKATQAAALEMAAKHVPWSDGKCSCGVRYYDHTKSHDPFNDWSSHIRSLVPPDSATALSRALDEARREELTELDKAICLLPRKKGNEPYGLINLDDALMLVRNRADTLRALTPAAPEAAREDREKPFFFAIETVDGDWHDGENCVFSDKASADDEVFDLNEDLPEDQWYRVVPLFRAPVPAERAGDAKANLKQRLANRPRKPSREIFKDFGVPTCSGDYEPFNALDTKEQAVCATCGGIGERGWLKECPDCHGTGKQRAEK